MIYKQQKTDPSDVFTVFLVEDKITEEFTRELGDELKADINKESSTIQ